MIYIIRHGQTENNKAKLLQGRTDVFLNEAGINEAKEAAAWFRDQNINFDIVYSSPLFRAVETARIVAPKTFFYIDERLIEMDYGPYEGMDLTNPAPEVMAFFSDFAHTPAPEGMEPLESVVIRGGSFMESLCRVDKNILISTHAIAMKGILEYLTPESHGSYWSKYIGNCAIYALEYKNGAFTVPHEVKR